MASSASVTLALRCGFNFSIPGRWASTTSTGDTARERIKPTISVADLVVRSSVRKFAPSYEIAPEEPHIYSSQTTICNHVPKQRKHLVCADLSALLV